MSNNKSYEVDKQSEWDSSFATLGRIGFLIQALHNAAIYHANQLYLDVQHQIFTEAQTKFKEPEINKCVLFQQEILTKKSKWGNNIYNSSLINRGLNGNENRVNNPKYMQSWDDIMNTAKDYQIYLMRCMDIHNLLIKESGTAMERFRGMK